MNINAQALIPLYSNIMSGKQMDGPLSCRKNNAVSEKRVCYERARGHYWKGSL